MINFFKEDVRFRLMHAETLKQWITRVFKAHHLVPANINYIFCSDRYLKKLNREFLNHDYFTDIITFDNTIKKGSTEADIFISIDRIRVNAKQYKTSFRDELHRVIIHGALHLCGMKDKNPKQKQEMREAEDYWLGRRRF